MMNTFTDNVNCFTFSPNCFSRGRCTVQFSLATGLRDIVSQVLVLLNHVIGSNWRSSLQ